MKLEFLPDETKIPWDERLTKSAIYATFVQVKREINR